MLLRFLVLRGSEYGSIGPKFNELAEVEKGGIDISQTNYRFLHFLI